VSVVKKEVINNNAAQDAHELNTFCLHQIDKLKLP